MLLDFIESYFEENIININREIDKLNVHKISFAQINPRYVICDKYKNVNYLDKL